MGQTVRADGIGDTAADIVADAIIREVSASELFALLLPPNLRLGVVDNPAGARLQSLGEGD